MKVAELIAILQEYPKDIIVVGDCGPLTYDDIYIKREYYNGDAANPKCEIIDKVLYIE